MRILAGPGASPDAAHTSRHSPCRPLTHQYTLLYVSLVRVSVFVRLSLPLLIYIIMLIKSISKKVYISGLVLIIGGFGWNLLPDYTKNAFKYLAPDLDDYKIFPNRIVKTSNSQSLPSDERYGTIQPTKEQLKYLQKRETGAYVVLRNGKVVYEYYDQGIGKDSISNSFSMAKSLTSLLIGKAIEEGFIHSVKDPVHKYLPQYEWTRDTSLTIEHILQMGAGFTWKEKYWNPLSWPVAGYYGTDLDNVMRHIENDIPGGKEYRYQSIATQVLGEILITTTGKTLTELMQTYFWQPMQMESDALWSLDAPNGRERAFCCFNATARDYARMGQLMLQDGVWNGQQLISKEYLDAAFTPASHMLRKDGVKVNFYGYQMLLKKYKDLDIKFFCGHSGQFVFIVPALDAVIVRLGHTIPHKFTDEGYFTETDQMLEVGVELLKNL